MRLLSGVLLVLFHCYLSQAQEADSLRAPAASAYEQIVNPDTLITGKITLEGNKVTRDFILRREIIIDPGDTILPGTLGMIMDRIQQNLMNTALFNFAEVYHTTSNDTLNLRIRVVERWYIWPMPFFEIAETNFNTWWLTRDFRRTIYGLYLSHDNFRGRKEILRFKAQLGYTHQFGLQYFIPYINKSRTIGTGFAVSYFSNKEIVYGTQDNKRQFYKDSNEPVRTEAYARLDFKYRKEIYNTHTAFIRYNMASVQDTVLVLRPDYFDNGRNEAGFLSIGYSFIRDRRDFKAYALKGYLAGGEIIRYGFGIPGEPTGLFNFFAYARKYIRFSDKVYFATGFKGKVSLPEKQPYYLQGGLGYRDLLRGYEYYVIDGQHWALMRNNVKFRLIKPSVIKLNFIPSERFNTIHYALYLNVFGDTGYVFDNYYSAVNLLANTPLYSYGIGLDFVTYYDRIMRLELSRNGLGETGFFINFTAPI